jgi:hypothetical protein
VKTLGTPIAAETTTGATTVGMALTSEVGDA